jgi:hypothetical protein
MLTAILTATIHCSGTGSKRVSKLFGTFNNQFLFTALLAYINEYVTTSISSQIFS